MCKILDQNKHYVQLHKSFMINIKLNLMMIAKSNEMRIEKRYQSIIELNNLDKRK